MSKPHERLALPVPLGRRLPQGIMGWNLLLGSLTLVLVGVYIIQVNRAATQGFTLREAEKRVDALQTEVFSLEDKVATLSSVYSLSERASQLGFVPIDRLEFRSSPDHAYALAK